MKLKLYFILGLLSLISVIYTLVVCPFCESNFLGIPISGVTDITIHTVIATVLLHGAYREYQKDNRIE